jgi:hypothetical protein
LDVLHHPNTVDIVIGQARFGAAGLTMFERILSILLGAGFSPEAAFDAYQSLYLFTLGFSAVSGRSPEFREGQRQGVLYMGSLPEERFPSIRTVAPVIGGRSPAGAAGDRSRRRHRRHRGAASTLDGRLTARRFRD